jgi:hypothetical protein
VTKIKDEYVQGDPDPKELAYQKLNLVELLGITNLDMDHTDAQTAFG